MSKKVALSSLGVMIALSTSFTLVRNGVVGQALLIASWHQLAINKSSSETWPEETSPRRKILLNLKPFEFSEPIYARHLMNL